MAALKAEYGVGVGVRWHIVPDLDGWALCRRLLSPVAETRPISDLTGEAIEAEHLCRHCRASFEQAETPVEGGDA